MDLSAAATGEPGEHTNCEWKRLQNAAHDVINPEWKHDCLSFLVNVSKWLPKSIDSTYGNREKDCPSKSQAVLCLTNKPVVKQVLLR